MSRASYSTRNKGKMCQHRRRGYPFRPDYPAFDDSWRNVTVSAQHLGEAAGKTAELMQDMGDALYNEDTMRQIRRDEIMEMTVKELAALAKSYGLPRFRMGHRLNGHELIREILDHEANVD